MDDPLFSTGAQAGAVPDRRSVVVVGLPRSGSSLLSQMMSELPGWYVFDDLYLARAAARAGVFDRPMTPAALDELLDFLGWQIRARRRFGLYAVPAVEEDEIEAMTDSLRTLFAGQGADWRTLQEEWLVRLAARAGCANWGYKMPGAFRHLDDLLARYPAMKAIFLMRAPEAVLASYKHMPETSEDGNPAQYHPLSHALYWAMAARAHDRALARHGAGRVMLLRYEDMIAAPRAALDAMADFLGTARAETAALPEARNTSFTGADRKGLTGLERRLVARIAGPARARLGFAEAAPPPPLAASDLGDLAAVTARTLRYRLGQAAGAARRKLGRGP